MATGSWNAEMTITRVARPEAAMRRAASMPSTPGMLTSMSTTSGASSRTRWAARAPLPDSPTTSMSPWVSTSSRRNIR